MSEAFARNTDPETSSEAAAFVKGKRATELQRKIMHTLTQAGRPLTAYQIARLGQTEYASITPRLKPMEKLGLIARGSKVAVEGRRPSLTWTPADPVQTELFPANVCKGCKKHAPSDDGWAGYCPWCDKKVDDAMGLVDDYRRAKGEI